MADNIKFVQAQEFRLSLGANTGATSLRIRLLKDTDGNVLDMDDFGTIGYGTLEPNTSREEQISWTGITDNGDDTYTLTGVKNVLTKAPYTESSGIAKTHVGGAVFIISNNPGLYNTFANKKNDETIENVWTFTVPNYPEVDTPGTEPTTDGQLIPKKYADDNKIDKDGTLAMAANLDMGSNKIVNVTDPTANQDAATKKYADDLAIAGAPDASDTVKGLVEQATDAQARDGDETGETGAKLFVTPKQINELSLGTGFGGDGSDGALTVSSGTTTIDLGGASVVIKNYTSISITGTGAIDFSNPHANGTTVIFKSQGNVTLTSSTAPMIDLRLMGAAGGSTGADGNDSYGVMFKVGAGEADAVISGASVGSGGVAPLNGVTVVAGMVTAARSTPIAPGAGGGGGQNQTGGRGGGAMLIECNGAFNFTTASGVNVSGQTPTDDAGRAPGGGGAGCFIVYYRTLTANTGTVVVTGGTGANGGITTGGGSGGGASVVNSGQDGQDSDDDGGNGGDGFSLIAYNPYF